MNVLYMYDVFILLSCRGNKVAELSDINKLKCLPMLRALSLTGI